MIHVLYNPREEKKSKCWILLWFFFSHGNFCYEKVYVGLWTQLRNYAKNVREKAPKCSLKTTKVLLDTDGHVLT